MMYLVLARIRLALSILEGNMYLSGILLLFWVFMGQRLQRCNLQLAMWTFFNQRMLGPVLQAAFSLTLYRWYCDHMLNHATALDLATLLIALLLCDLMRKGYRTISFCRGIFHLQIKIGILSEEITLKQYDNLCDTYFDSSIRHFPLPYRAFYKRYTAMIRDTWY